MKGPNDGLLMIVLMHERLGEAMYMRSDTYAASPQPATTPLMAGAFRTAFFTTPGTGAAPGVAEGMPASVVLAAALRRSASGEFFPAHSYPA